MRLYLSGRSRSLGLMRGGQKPTGTESTHGRFVARQAGMPAVTSFAAALLIEPL
jgi:hypothetical protein